MLSFLTSVLVFTFAFSAKASSPLTFSVVTSQPSQCDPFTINFSGGTPPLTLTLYPTGGNPITNNVTSTNGTYTIQSLQNIPTTSKSDDGSTTIDTLFYAAMGDATGPFAGGALAQAFSIQPTTTGAKCNTNFQQNDFFFSFNSQNNVISQCGSQNFTLYPGPTGKQPQFPVYFSAIVAGGTSQYFQVPESNFTKSGNSWTWTWPVDLSTSYAVMFSFSDSKNGQGGSSGIKSVVSSGNTSCLTSEATTPSSDGSRLSTGAIIGIVVGIVGALFIIAVLSFMFYRHRRRENKKRFLTNESIDDFTTDHGVTSPTGVAQPTPFMLQRPPTPPQDAYPGRQSTTISEYYNPSAASRISTVTDPERPLSTVRSEFSKSSRFIQHTDAADAEDEEIEELPPVYKDFGTLRPPPVDLKGRGSSNTGSSSSSSPMTYPPPPPPLPTTSPVRHDTSASSAQASSSTSPDPTSPHQPTEFNPYT